MRVVPYDIVVENVARLVAETNYTLPQDVFDRIEQMRGKESSGLAVSIIDQIIENAGIATSESMPLCQDTGVSVYFVEIGNGVVVDGAGIYSAVQEATRRGYREGGLRMSIVDDPLRRTNTGDNTPAIIHYSSHDKDDSLSITFCPKGGGCENMSAIAMLSPGDGRKGVIDFVIDTVRKGGGRPCPPLLIGVGIGGNFESSAIIAKHSLARKVGDRNADPMYAELEDEMLERINDLGIGPMGLGGDTTALDVFIETAPCHIASMPVAVNIQCHSARHGHLDL